MLTATGSLAAIRPHYEAESREVFRVLLNAVSATEANFALDILLQSLPEKALVTAVNLREVLQAIPASPFSMRVDEATLMKTAGLEKGRAVMSKVLDDGLELVVTTAGNLVLDVIVRADGEKYYWSPVPIIEDRVNPALIDLLIESDCLLEAVIDLVQSMGLVFNPKFYLSLDDWHLEYAEDAMRGLGDLFGLTDNWRDSMLQI